jgi:hypothetical protein
MRSTVNCVLRAAVAPFVLITVVAVVHKRGAAVATRPAVATYPAVATRPATTTRPERVATAPATSNDIWKILRTTAPDGRYGVVGVLSSEANRSFRDAQRRTWMSENVTNIRIKFLLDRPSNVTAEEAALHGDVLFLNSSFSGRAVRFGEKMDKWLRLSHVLFPDASFVAKMDDDVYLCPASIWKLVWMNWSPLLYLGWAHFKFTRPSQELRMDEVFVVVGSRLVERLVERRYCDDLSVCDNATDLYDTGSGGTSLGLWLSSYDDVHAVPINHFVIHQGPHIPHARKSPIRQPEVAFRKVDVCESHVLFHKARPDLMDIMSSAAH